MCLQMSVMLAALAGCARNAMPAPEVVGTAERPDAALHAKLAVLAAEVHGDAGIYVRHLKTGRSAAIRADELFPTASTIKVPILIGTFDAIRKGQFTFQTLMTYRDSLRYQYDDSLSMPRDGARIPVSELTLRMITESNNTAALWLQGLARGDTINAWLHNHGFDSTRVNSRVQGREANRAQYGWGQTTPREMANLMVMIREGRAVSRAASEEMYRQFVPDSGARRLKPPEVP